MRGVIHAHKRPVVPCSDCHTLEGYTPTNQHRPLRYNGARYGVAGKLCKACYCLRWWREHNPGHSPRLAVALPPGPAEIAARTARIRAVKAAKGNFGRGGLSPKELDAVLPPVKCQRSKEAAYHERRDWA